MEEEFFITGFCRVQNQGRSVTLELDYASQPTEILDVSCGFEHCIHKDSCEVAREIRRKIDVSSGEI